MLRAALLRAALLRAALPLAILAVTGACGGGSPTPARPTPTPRPPVGQLDTLIPPDVTLLLRARPSALFSTPAAAEVLAAVFPEARLEAFAIRTGVDPRSLAELVFAVHGEGHVVIARGPIDAALAAAEAGERMAPVESRQDEPLVRRAGFLGARRVEVVALAPDVLLWVDGSPQLAARVLAAAARPEVERDHPLERGELAEIDDALADADFVVLAPQPLGLPLETGIGLVLARERALGLAVVPGSRAELLEVRAELRGEFPPDVELNLRALARSIAETDLGAVLALRHALPTLEVVAADGAVRARAEAPAGVLAAGFRTLLGAELEELLEGAPAPPMPPGPATDAQHIGSDTVPLDGAADGG